MGCLQKLRHKRWSSYLFFFISTDILTELKHFMQETHTIGFCYVSSVQHCLIYIICSKLFNSLIHLYIWHTSLVSFRQYIQQNFKILRYISFADISFWDQKPSSNAILHLLALVKVSSKHLLRLADTQCIGFGSVKKQNIITSSAQAPCTIPRSTGEGRVIRGWLVYGHSESTYKLFKFDIEYVYFRS